MTDDEITIDSANDTVTICGIRYALDLFRAIGCDGLPVGSHLKIVARNDGVVTFHRIYPSTPGER